MTHSCAKRQDIRPMKVLVLNLMPNKVETENQLLRLLSSTPLQVDVQFLYIGDRQSKRAPVGHLDNFYCDFDVIRDDNFDGMIITGAPLGLVPFEKVTYWAQVVEIIRWAEKHVFSTLFLCWAAQAALKILYGVPKLTLERKLSGVYEHKVLKFNEPLTRGFDRIFLAPHSHYANFSSEIIEKHTDLVILCESEQAGAYLFARKDRRMVFVTGHPEYDAITLAEEYRRDCASDASPPFPVNYFPHDNPGYTPEITWRSHGYLLFGNWLNYCVYQETPYDLKNISRSVLNS